MNELSLGALDGRLPLGFLAACGTLRLLAQTTKEDGPRPRLAWDPMNATAVLHTDLDLDEVIETLQKTVAKIDKDALLPGIPATWPSAKKPNRHWPKNDSMRVPIEEFRTSVDQWRQAPSPGDPTDEWVPAMVTDLVVEQAAKPTADYSGACVEITPFAAPSGRQTFFTMLDKTLAAVRQNPELLREALLSWRRYDRITGEYLDHHALRSATDRTDGKSNEAGVPGATWLAVMSLPMWPTYGTGSHKPLAGGWQRVGRRSVFVWPLWSDALDIDAVRAVATLPGLRVQPTENDRNKSWSEVSVNLSPLRPYSIFLVQAAHRHQIEGRNFAGVLAPVPVRLR